MPEKNTHDVALARAPCDVTGPILDRLLEHYRCSYILISMSDDHNSHIPCVRGDAGCRDVFPKTLAHFRGTSFCAQTLNRPIPVIVTSMPESVFADHPLVTGHPNITAFVGVPIIFDEDVYVGSLCMFWTARAAPCSEDIRAYAMSQNAASEIGAVLKPYRVR